MSVRKLLSILSTRGLVRLIIIFNWITFCIDRTLHRRIFLLIQLQIRQFFNRHFFTWAEHVFKLFEVITSHAYGLVDIVDGFPPVFGTFRVAMEFFVQQKDIIKCARFFIAKLQQFYWPRDGAANRKNVMFFLLFTRLVHRNKASSYFKSKIM